MFLFHNHIDVFDVYRETRVRFDQVIIILLCELILDA